MLSKEKIYAKLSANVSLSYNNLWDNNLQELITENARN